jgi:hypothetical protein
MFSESDLIFSAPDTDWLGSARGNYARSIAVVVSAQYFSPEETAFLEKVLNAAKINLSNDVLLLQKNEAEPVSIAPVLQAKNPQFVLVFGLAPADIGLQLQHQLYQPDHFYRSTWLWANDLPAIAVDRNLKTKLWTALQQLFL